MKQALILLVILSLCLTGCGGKADAVFRNFTDLSIEIPEDYLDLSKESFAVDLDFIFGKDPITVSGYAEEKEAFLEYGLELDLQDYGELLMASNKVESQLTEKNGIYCFTYTAGEFTYLVTLWETESSFWTVQAYCMTKEYSKVEDEIWKILSSVTA